jgi:PD-(D/E)XK nuclease superfamily
VLYLRLTTFLGFDFLEKVYQQAIQVELQTRGVKVELEPKIQFKGASLAIMRRFWP